LADLQDYSSFNSWKSYSLGQQQISSLGLSPWNPESLSKISSREIPSVSMQVLLDESASIKLKKLGLKGKFQVSVLSGLIEVIGSDRSLFEAYGLKLPFVVVLVDFQKHCKI
jgi:hypothetical protein